MTKYYDVAPRRPVRITIRRVADGLRRTHETGFPVYQASVGEVGDPFRNHIDFIYKDGNWSCDCNRELDFMRAGSAEEIARANGENDNVCCSYGRFVVEEIRTLDTDEVVYKE